MMIKQLGEGLYENRTDNQIARKLWLELLASEASLHIGIGEAINCLLSEIYKQTANKNISIIVVGFEALRRCLKEVDRVELPYVEGTLRIDEQLE